MVLVHGLTRAVCALEAKLEILASSDTYDWYAEEGLRSYGRIVPGRHPGQRISVVHEPVGAVAAFAP